MKPLSVATMLMGLAAMSSDGLGQDAGPLKDALTFHASFDDGMNADFSKGDPACYLIKEGELVDAKPNDNVQISEGTGRFGSALLFTRKSGDWPRFKGTDVLGYNDENWNASVSLWLRLDPDKDLEPGYCDPVQIVGDDLDKGFIFLEWSKDHTPRRFRYAIRPLVQIWNPNNLGWEEIPVEKRPMIELTRSPFSADSWTHVVFTLENVNDDAKPSRGRLFVNGEPQGTIENWDLTFGWDPQAVQLVLGAAYVGQIDDVAVFSRPLTVRDVKQVYQLKDGVRELYEE